MSNLRKELVYVAGPISKGPFDEHLRAAVHAGDTIMGKGHAAIVPQLSMLWQFISPHTWKEWLEMDEIIIGRCDYLLRLPGESTGADREVSFARGRGIPVYYELPDLIVALGRADRGITL
jgi:hypothetical protein